MMTRSVLFVCSLWTVLLVLLGYSAAYKPVILMHGFAISTTAGTYHDFDRYVNWIESNHTGQLAISLNVNNGLESTRPMYEQIHDVYLVLNEIMANHSTEFQDGFHIVAHSQGALLMRSVVEMFGFQVDNFISLAGVHMGVYGFGDLNDYPFANFTKLELTQIFYTPILQNAFSLANWWHDPVNETTGYLASNEFLPIFNQELSQLQPMIKNNLVNSIHGGFYAFGSPDDGTVVPWISELFGFYDENFNLQNMTYFSTFTNDTFGLKTLYQSGRLHLLEFPGIKHAHWLSDQSIYDQYVLPLLN